MFSISDPPMLPGPCGVRSIGQRTKQEDFTLAHVGIHQLPPDIPRRMTRFTDLTNGMEIPPGGVRGKGGTEPIRNFFG